MNDYSSSICGLCRHYQAGGYCWKRHRDVAYMESKPCYEGKEVQPVKPEKVAGPTKVCRQCGRALPLDHFQHHAKTADGLMNVCCECRRKAPKTQYAGKPIQTPEERAEKARAWRKAYYQTHKEQCRATTYAWRERNRERYRATRKALRESKRLSALTDDQLLAEIRRRGLDVTTPTNK